MAASVQEFDLIQRIRVEDGVPRVISTTIQVIEGGEDLLSFAIDALKKGGIYEKYSEHQTSQYIGYRLKTPKKGEKGARRYQLILLQKKDELCIALNKKLFSGSYLTLKVRVNFSIDVSPTIDNNLTDEFCTLAKRTRNIDKKTNNGEQQTQDFSLQSFLLFDMLRSKIDYLNYAEDFLLGRLFVLPSKENIFLTKLQELYPDVLHGETTGEKYLNTSGEPDQSEPLIDFDWNQEDELPTPKFNISNIVKDLKAGKEYLILSENSLFPYTWEVSISSIDNLKEFLNFFIPKLMEF